MNLGVKGTVARSEFSEWEWTVPDFLSPSDDVGRCEDSLAFKAYFRSPSFKIDKKECVFAVFIRRDGDYCATLSVLNSDDTSTFACFMGYKKSDGSVEDRFLSTSIHSNTVFRIGFYLQRNELETRQSTLLPSNTLTLICKVEPVEHKIPVDMNQIGTFGRITMLDIGKWEWKLPNFLSCQPKFFRSDTFYFRTFPSEWVLLVECVYENILVHVQMLEWGLDIPFSCSIGFKKSDGTIEERFHPMPRTFSLNSWQLLFRLPTRELHSRRDDFLPSGTLTVIFNIRIPNYATEQQGTITCKDTGTTKEKALPKSVVNLMKEYKQLFLNEEDTDVVLNVKGKEFRAHRSILKARSPVLSATFEHDMVEKRTGKVVIDDCDPESFSDFLQFLYAGQTPMYSSSDHALSLYRTAHKYDVPDLLNECIQYLMGHLTDQNICEVMSLALQYDIDELQKVAESFFLENASTIVKSSEFGKFMASNIREAQRLFALFAETKE